MEPHRSKGFTVSGWKTSQVLVTTMSLMVMSLVFLLAWEGTRPLLLVLTPETKISSLNWYYGEREHTKAVWDSTYQDELGVPKMIERRWRLTTRLTQPRNDGVSLESTLAESPRDKLVGLSSSWETVLPDNFLDTKSNSSSAEGGTALDEPSSLKNDENAGDPLSVIAADGDSKSDFPSQTKDVEDSSLETDFSSDVANVSISTTANSEVGGFFQNFMSTKALPGSAVTLEAGSDATTDEDLKNVAAGSMKINTTSVDVCDFSRGYWVRDENRPLYDGRKCKAYLAGMWACREMNRPDFEYEKLRWQPDGCDLPIFSSQGFLERMKNKVIAFMGDSLGRQQFQSLMCMLTEGKDENQDVEEVADEWPLARTRGSLRAKGYVYKFKKSNTTVMFYWSATLSRLEPDRKEEENGRVALHLDQPDDFLREQIEKLDVLILNSGHHWNRGKFENNKWHMYADGKPLARGKLTGIGDAYNYSMYKIVEYLDAKLADTGGKPTVYMRTLSPRHFKNGEWNTGGTCDNTRPQYSHKVIPYKGPATETVIEKAVSGSKIVHLLNITPLSSSREEGHISKYSKGNNSNHQDCLHWCLPGVPDTWNELLYGLLTAGSSPASAVRAAGSWMG